MLIKTILAIAVSAITVILSKYYIHMLQLEGYFLSQFSHHLFSRILHPSKFFRGKAKKELHYTSRVKRLFFACSLLTLLLSLAVILLLSEMWFVIFVLPLFCSIIVFAAALLCLPCEKLIARYYINDAKRILATYPDLKIIGITGSYGKTSTKFILSTLLSEKFAVLTPPSSYNTPLGIVRVIREQLQPDDEIFVCEMGSRHLGDINEICRFIHPDSALITSIGPQHLDTFGSVENVKKAKFELIEALGDNGTAFFPSNSSETLELFEKAKCKKFLAGPGGVIWAENLTVGVSGSAFTLKTDTGESVECSTRLLGEHNISNIVLAASVALNAGLSLNEISRGISKITPVQHRLEIVSARPVTIIDDAFNSSPRGAEAALKVLSQFTGRRIIITPGFVELGSGQNEYHREYGKQIAQSADIAVLVGQKRTQAINDGIGGACETHIVNSLSEATALLKTITVPGDVVLFENDLPDNYE